MFKISYEQIWKQDEAQMLKDIKEKSKSENLWKQAIQKANEEFKKKFQDKDYDKYELFTECLENIKSVDITKCQIPLFEAFVFELFVESDKELYKQLKKFGGMKQYFCRIWLDDWRDVPDWYSYHHDVLLLELVMRNGLDCDEIINDLNGDKNSQYILRLSQSRTDFQVRSFYEFKTWCKQKLNVLHRLKHVTKTIIQSLQKDCYEPCLIDIRSTKTNKDQYAGHNQIFSRYEYNTHKTFMEQKPKVRLGEQSKPDAYKIAARSQTMDVDTIVMDRSDNASYRSSQEDDEDEDIKYAAEDQKADRIYSTYHKQLKKEVFSRYIIEGLVREYEGDEEKVMAKLRELKEFIQDPYLSRNIDDELFDALNCFDLMTYGKPLALFIVHQLKQEDKVAYWKVLGELLGMLPYPIAKETMDLVMDFLQYAKTDTLRELCMYVVKGTQFKPSAALGMSEFFDDLAQQDMIQATEWNNIGSQFESIATEEMQSIESNHLLFVALTVPITTHKGKSLLSLALEQERRVFLNSERIANVSQHQYRTGFLKPSDIDADTKPLTWSQLLHKLVSEPFNFYFTAQGYHWIGGTLLMLYLGYLYFYAYFRPLSGAMIDPSERAREAILWICNLGYIAYEIFEVVQKGLSGYFNLGLKGQTNMMDAVICLIWIILFIIRWIFIAIYLIDDQIEGENSDSLTSLQDCYVFLFGFQVVLVTLRSLSTFSNTEYLGPLLKTIKLMCIEIYKFLFIYIIVMIGVMFGLWFIVVTNHKPDPDDFEPDNLWHAFLYVLEVFIGSADLSGIREQDIAIVFMIFATFLGTLMLTNLLIALMATEYENVRERAQQEVLFNQMELTFDLSKKPRLMPPPLNIIVFVLALFIWSINVILSVMSPSFNIFTRLNYNLFAALREKQFKYGWPLWIMSILTILWVLFIAWNYHYLRFIIAVIVAILYWMIVCFIVLYNVYRIGFIHHKKSEIPKYFQRFSRGQLCRWYCCCMCRYECCKCRCAMCEEDARWMQSVHHKGCYAELILHCRDANKSKNPVKGITMTQYIDEYERKHNEIQHHDKSVIKMLTTDTLFCEQCYRPFERSKIKKQLASAWEPLFDFCSAMTFVLIPLVWIPLVLIFGLMALKDWICKCFREDAEQNRPYTNQNFDAEYYPLNK